MKCSWSESVLGALVSLDSLESLGLGLRNSPNEVLNLLRSCTGSPFEWLLRLRKRFGN